MDGYDGELWTLQYSYNLESLVCNWLYFVMTIILAAVMEECLVADDRMTRPWAGSCWSPTSGGSGRRGTAGAAPGTPCPCPCPCPAPGASMGPGPPPSGGRVCCGDWGNIIIAYWSIGCWSYNCLNWCCGQYQSVALLQYQSSCESRAPSFFSSREM